MRRYSLTHLSNEVLDSQLITKAANEKGATAELLAHIAESDERKRYLPAAYESMLAYCIGELGFSKDEAKQRIQIARAGRACPGVFEALEQGRIHLTGLRLLAPHLTPENAGELLSAAAHKSKEDIERLLAERSPRLDVPDMVVPVAVEGALEHLGKADSQGVASAPASLGSCSRFIPLSSETYAVQFTRSREADERFRHAQDLLGHQVKSSDLAEVYGRAIEALIEKLERIRFGAGAKPRKSGRRAKAGSRHVSVEVKRTVWIRDKGQCTFRSESGRRSSLPATPPARGDPVAGAAGVPQGRIAHRRRTLSRHGGFTARRAGEVLAPLVRRAPGAEGAAGGAGREPYTPMMRYPAST